MHYIINSDTRQLQALNKLSIFHLGAIICHSCATSANHTNQYYVPQDTTQPSTYTERFPWAKAPDCI